MKIDVLGTKYNIVIDSELEKLNADGECKRFIKLIRIRPEDSMCYEESTVDERSKCFKEVLRHEIIHAFLDESGLNNYSSDEQLVDWLAIQFPKLQKAFNEAGCSD